MMDEGHKNRQPAKHLQFRGGGGVYMSTPGLLSETVFAFIMFSTSGCDTLNK